jgi:PadR family transcriptional regulator, regulatory protein AphA
MPRNPTCYVILGLLSVQPNLSGYDMRKAVQGSIGFFWGESYGQIYPALKQLTREGLIAQSSSGSNGRKKRQEYVLAEPGRHCLREWLAVPFCNEPLRNEFLLKLFFAREAAPGVAAAHIRDLQERNQRMLDTLRKIEASGPSQQEANPHLPYWMLTLSLGNALTCAALEWGEKALVALSACEESAGAIPPPPVARAQAAAARTQPPAKRSQPNARRVREATVTSHKPGRGKRAFTKSERKVAR